MRTERNEFTEYALDVVEGKAVAGDLIRKACLRYLSWFGMDDRYFDEKAASKVVKFISHFRHWSGRWKDKPFNLLPFQKFIVYSIFGFKWKSSGERVIKKVYVSMARKNAKTMLASAIQAYMLVAEGEGDSQVYTIANTTSQASLAFDMEKTLLKQLDPKGKFFKYYRDMVKFPHTNSLLRVLSSDYSRLDGLNAYSAIVDEYHAATTNEVYSILRTSQASRTNSLIMVITTAGFRLESPCKQMEDACVDILNGVVRDDSQLAIIFTLDEGDDYRDESVWVKANPSLGEIVRPEYLREQVRECANNSSLETSVKTKNFNMWVATAEEWIPMNIVSSAQVRHPEGYWSDKTVWCGLDLSSVSDLTALTMMCLDGDEYHFRTRYYLPSDTVKDSPNRELYRHWASKGYVTVTAGNVVDYDYILNDLMEISGEVDAVADIGYDKWNSTYLILKAQEQGLPLTPISQSIGAMNKPTKEMTRLMLSGKVKFEHSPVTRWCFANCATKSDWNNNLKVVKGAGSERKIDGVVSMIMALASHQGASQGGAEAFALTF